MESRERFLDPDDYNVPPFYYRIFFFLRGYSIEVGILGLGALIFAIDTLTGNSAADDLTDSMILIFILTQLAIPYRVTQRAKDLASRGESPPESIKDVRHSLTEAATTLTFVSVITLALLIYGWTASSSFIQTAGYTRILALITELCLMVWVSALGWRYVMGQILSEKYGSAYSSIAVLLPTGVMFLVTRLISVQSGVPHWQDSIVVYLPAVIMTLYFSISTSGDRIPTPDKVMKQLEKLKKGRGEQARRVEWLQSRGQSQKKEKAKYTREKAKLSEIDRTISRYTKAMQTYGELVAGVIASIGQYRRRRAYRDDLLSAGSESGNRLDAGTVELVTKGLDLIRPPPPELPPPYFKTRTFEFMRKSVVFLFFPSVLTWMGLYTRMAPTPAMEAQTLEFDQTMFRKVAPSSFEYYIHRHEVPEITWLWSQVRNVDSAKHCVEFISNLRTCIQEYNQMMIFRESGRMNMAKMQPESGEAESLERLRNTRMNKFAASIAPARLHGAREAWKTVQPVIQTLNMPTDSEGNVPKA